MKIPLTTYQSEHNRVGYLVFKANKKRIAEKEVYRTRKSVVDLTPRYPNRGARKMEREVNNMITLTNRRLPKSSDKNEMSQL